MKKDEPIYVKIEKSLKNQAIKFITENKIKERNPSTMKELIETSLLEYMYNHVHIMQE